MDHIRRILNKCNISTTELNNFQPTETHGKVPVRDANGLATYNVAADQAAEDRRTRRHNPPNPPTTGPRCPQCNRICASEFRAIYVSRPHQQHSEQHKRHRRTRRTRPLLQASSLVRR